MGESDLYGLNIKIAALWPEIKREQYQSADQENYAEVYERACELRIGGIVIDEHEKLSEIFNRICSAINIEPLNIQEIYRPNNGNKEENEKTEVVKIKQPNYFPNDIIAKLCTPKDKNFLLESIFKFSQCARRKLTLFHHIDLKPPSGPYYIAMQYNAIILDRIWKFEYQIDDLRGDIREVQQQFAELEDYATACELLMADIPFVEGENLVEIFEQICATIKISPPKIQRITRLYTNNKPTLIRAELWTPSDKDFVLESIAQFQKLTNQKLKLRHAGFKLNNTPIYIKDSLIGQEQHIIRQRNLELENIGFRLIIHGIPIKINENLPDVIEKVCRAIKFQQNGRIRKLCRLADGNVILVFLTAEDKLNFSDRFREYQSSAEPLKAYHLGFYIDWPITLRDYPSAQQLEDQLAKEEIRGIACQITIEDIPFDDHENPSEIFEKICDVLLISPIKVKSIYRAYDCENIPTVIDVELCSRSDKILLLESIASFMQRTQQPLKLYHAGINIDDKPFTINKCLTTRKIFKSNIQRKDLPLEEIDIVYMKTQIDILRKEVQVLQRQLAKEENYSAAVELILEGFPADEPNIFKKICDTIKVSPPKTLNIHPQHETANKESGNKSTVIKVELWTPTDKKIFLQSVNEFSQNTNKQLGSSNHVKKDQVPKIICRTLMQYEDQTLQNEDWRQEAGTNNSVIKWNLKIEGVPYDERENLSLIFENLCNALEIPSPWKIQNVSRINYITINVELLAPQHTFFFLDSIPTYLQLTREQLKIESNIQEKDIPVFIKVYKNEDAMQQEHEKPDEMRSRYDRQIGKCSKPVRLKVEGIPYDENENLAEICEKLIDALKVPFPLNIKQMGRRFDAEHKPDVIIMDLIKRSDKILFISPSETSRQIAKEEFKVYYDQLNISDGSPITITECEYVDVEEFDSDGKDILHKLAEQEKYAATCQLRIEGIPFDKQEDLFEMFENLCGALYLLPPLRPQSISRLRDGENKPTGIIVELETSTDKYIFLEAVASLALVNEQLKLHHAGVHTCADSPITIKECSSHCSLFRTALQHTNRYAVDSNHVLILIADLRTRVRQVQRQLAEQEIYTTACELRIENVPYEDDEHLYGIFKALCNTLKISTPKIQKIYRLTTAKPTLVKRAKGNKHRPIIVKLWTPADAYFVLLSIAKFSQRTKQELVLRHLGFGKGNADARAVADFWASARARERIALAEKKFFYKRSHARFMRRGLSDDEDDMDDYVSFWDIGEGPVKSEKEPETTSDTEFNVDPNIDVDTPIYVKENLTQRNLVIFQTAKQYKKQNQLADVFVRRGLVYVKTCEKDTITCVYSLSMLNDFVRFPDPVKSIRGFEVHASD